MGHFSCYITGSLRDMHRCYQDAMATVRKYGKHDYFITVTCNPAWPDINEALLPGQNAADQPDIVARVFRRQLNKLLCEIVDDGIFGSSLVHMQIIEFQKCGLPHAHLLLIVNRNNKLRTVDDINKMVCAQIPADEEQWCIILCCMAHRCNSTCQKDGKCTKHFPKPFAEYTSWEDNEMIPKYRRRASDTGGRQEVICGQTVNNKWIVPYNPYLSKKYRCHINVRPALLSRPTNISSNTSTKVMTVQWFIIH